MSSELFTPDPREILFLHNHLQKLLMLADTSSGSISVREDDDFGFMTVHFLYKQLQHTESVLCLVPRRDAGLIARTMIEGLYQLLWAFQVPKERARLWRSFSLVNDWRLVQERLQNGIPVCEEDICKIEAGLKEFGNLHRVKKSNSPDPYHKSWRGGTKLSQMADVVGRELYDVPYAELSDWQHWGVRGIGEAISRHGDRITVDSNSDRVACQCFHAAFQCLFQTLEVANAHFSLNISDEIESLGKDFNETMELRCS